MIDIPMIRKFALTLMEYVGLSTLFGQTIYVDLLNKIDIALAIDGSGLT